MTDDEPMSARDLRLWLVGAGPGLAARGIDATHGAGPRLNAEGASWISFTSRWGSGRLVREADGSSRSRAQRYAGGVAVLDSAAGTTTEELLALVAAAVDRPA